MIRNIFCMVAIALIMAIGCTSIPAPLANILPPVIVHGIQGGTHLANAITLSEDDERSLGQSVGVAITNRYQLLQNPQLLTYVSLVGLTVAHTSPRPDLPYVFGILDTPEVNAFSGPHGYVFITRGALATMQDEAELAGVLAHEESHVILHHGLEQVRAAELQGTASELMKSMTKTQAFSQLADLGVDAITKTGYSQPQELDADGSAVGLVSSAGYSPVSYLNFLERLQTLQAGSGAGTVMSTHPGVPDRIARVKEAMAKVSPNGATLADRFHVNVKL